MRLPRLPAGRSRRAPAPSTRSSTTGASSSAAAQGSRQDDDGRGARTRGARRGRDAVVVTIDPAKRLANALGLDALSDTASTIDPERWDPDGTAAPGGRLSALMLDTKSTFDSLVTRNASDDEQARRILENTFYRNVSGALSGTQEYMAMEKLHELHDEGGYDLIVVDTPPSRHALDFLDAPKRLIRLLDNRIFRLLMMPTRAYLRVAGVAVQAFLRTVARVVGSDVIDDVVAFFRAFEGMEEGFRERASAVEVLLADSDTCFVLITSPRRDAVDEAHFFAEKITEHGIRVDALVVNRVHPQFGDESPEGLRARAAELVDEPPAGGWTDETRAAARRLAALYDNLADFNEVARRERRNLVDLRDRIGTTAAVAYVPFLAHDVHDFDTLDEVSDLVFGRGGAG
ncbi:MAG: ArsA family ATPase [Acidimicrobiia bacterium]|nr:ArsA family ATPase [Acidimicrobiia bacterium]